MALDRYNVKIMEMMERLTRYKPHDLDENNEKLCKKLF